MQSNKHNHLLLNVSLLHSLLHPMIKNDVILLFLPPLLYENEYEDEEYYDEDEYSDEYEEGESTEADE